MPEMDGFTLVERLRERQESCNTTILMLTSAGQRGDAARCRALGIAAYLTKPVYREQLIEAIQAALGRRQPQTGAPELVTRHNLRVAESRLNILLAEDNAVNQKLAVRLLEKQGHTVTVAGDGRAVLQALETREFDLVLMDVEMPDMDGLEATQKIREREQATGKHLPIIAMTAHAMKGDRDRCLSAGMDGYVSKPIRVQELVEEIERTRAPALRSPLP